jgi:hypothetical protein
MTPAEDGLPRVAPSARTLGIRRVDVHLDSEGRVQPGQCGLSVSPDSIWHIPNHRRPRGMGNGSTGHPDDYVFAIAKVSPELSIRLDPLRPALHAFIEPSEPTLLVKFETYLVDTRPNWQKVWP